MPRGKKVSQGVCSQEKVDECLKQGKVCNVETNRCVAPATAQMLVRKEGLEVDLDYGIVGRKEALAKIRQHLVKKSQVKVSSNSSSKRSSRKSSSRSRSASRSASRKSSKKASSKKASRSASRSASRKSSKKASRSASRSASRKSSKKASRKTSATKNLQDLKEVAKESAVVAQAADLALTKGPIYTRAELLQMKLPQIKDVAKQLKLKKYQTMRKEMIATMILATYNSSQQIAQVAKKAVKVAKEVRSDVAHQSDRTDYTWDSLMAMNKPDLRQLAIRLGLKRSMVNTKEMFAKSILESKKQVQQAEKVIEQRVEEATEAADHAAVVATAGSAGFAEEEVSSLPPSPVVELMERAEEIIEPLSDKLAALEKALEDEPNCVEKYACGMGEVCNAETGDCQPGTSHLYKLVVGDHTYHGSEDTLKRIATSKNVAVSTIVKVAPPMQPDTLQKVTEIISSNYPMTEEERFIYDKVKKCLGV